MSSGRSRSRGSLDIYSGMASSDVHAYWLFSLVDSMRGVHTTGSHATSGVLGSYPLELLGVLYLCIHPAGPHALLGTQYLYPITYRV